MIIYNQHRCPEIYIACSVYFVLSKLLLVIMLVLSLGFSGAGVPGDIVN